MEFGEVNCTEPTHVYCPPSYAKFWINVQPFILNVNLVLCIFGIVSNFLSLLVYSHKSMLNSTNVLLVGISFSDMVAMIGFIPEYAAQSRYMRSQHAYSTAIIWIIHEFLIAIFHPVSIWLTTTLAVWRYIAVVHPFQNNVLCTMKRAKIIMAAFAFLSLAICLPNYVPGISVQVVPENETTPWPEGGCGSTYCTLWTSYNISRKIEFWYHGFVSKVIPGIILIFVSTRLIRALIEAGRRKQLRKHGESLGRSRINSTRTDSTGVAGAGAVGDEEGNRNHVTHKNSGEPSNEFDRVTKMLIVILLIFLLTELPPGILYVLETFFETNFYYECRKPMHHFILTMMFLSGFLNFIVYVIMSRQFRLTLVRRMATLGLMKSASVV